MRKAPSLIIHTPTQAEEFKRIWDVLTEMDFFREHGYKIILPEHAFYKELAIRAPKITKADKTKAKKIFITDIYDKEFYQPAHVQIKDCQDVLTRSFATLAEMRAQWGFKIFTKYKVLLTRYGTNGSYFEDTGTIQIRYNDNGKIGRLGPSQTIMHEIVHCGIEECIIRKFKLTHPEKERLVDWIVKLKLEEFLFGPYSFQDLGDERISKYMSPASIAKLPETIRDYVTSNPR